MSGPETGPIPEGGGEFEAIARLMRPLAAGAPGALDLLDDACVVPSRPGFDLVISKDAMVAGVHFPPDLPRDLVARRLLRTNLSDLAAKAAEPFGYLLALAWPQGTAWAEREAFARGLAEDGATFGLALLGGDTVTTPGPLIVSATILGWVPAGAMVRRAGARAGDLLAVSGVVGDGGLGLAQVGLTDPDPWLLDRYHLPTPRLGLREALRACATAAADVSDGLVADAGHLATASGLALDIELADLPLSAPAAAWLAGQGDRAAGLARLATSGDDYEVVCAVPPERLAQMQALADVPLTVVGRFSEGQGVRVTADGRSAPLARAGYSHD
jgi:thiamine-monophosphate kinase